MVWKLLCCLEKMSDENWNIYNSSDTDPDTDTESDINDYQEGSDVEVGGKSMVESLFGDLSDLEDDDGQENEMPEIVSRPVLGRRSVNKRQKNRRLIDQFDSDIPNFSSLEPEEMHLPFSHILSSYQEWKRIEDACLSGFRDVSELSKVRNKTIRLVADAAEYALQKQTALLPSLNKAFVVYAGQRNL
jgi:hypothetical protein